MQNTLAATRHINSKLKIKKKLTKIQKHLSLKQLCLQIFKEHFLDPFRILPFEYYYSDRSIKHRKMTQSKKTLL